MDPRSDDRPSPPGRLWTQLAPASRPTREPDYPGAEAEAEGADFPPGRRLRRRWRWLTLGILGIVWIGGVVGVGCTRPAPAGPTFDPAAEAALTEVVSEALVAQEAPPTPPPVSARAEPPPRS